VVQFHTLSAALRIDLRTFSFSSLPSPFPPSLPPPVPGPVLCEAQQFDISACVGHQVLQGAGRRAYKATKEPTKGEGGGSHGAVGLSLFPPSSISLPHHPTRSRSFHSLQVYDVVKPDVVQAMLAMINLEREVRREGRREGGRQDLKKGTWRNEPTSPLYLVAIHGSLIEASTHPSLPPSLLPSLLPPHLSGSGHRPGPDQVVCGDF